MKKILNVKWENISLIIMLVVLSVTIYMAYLSPYEVKSWMLVLITMVETLIVYFGFKLSRKMLKELY